MQLLLDRVCKNANELSCCWWSELCMLQQAVSNGDVLRHCVLPEKFACTISARFLLHGHPRCLPAMGCGKLSKATLKIPFSLPGSLEGAFRRHAAASSPCAYHLDAQPTSESPRRIWKMGSTLHAQVHSSAASDPACRAWYGADSCKQYAQLDGKCAGQAGPQNWGAGFPRR